MEPISEWWNGCSSGKQSAGSFSHQVPYGWLSTDQRRSFFTTSRCVSSFCCVNPGRNRPMRSASSHNASDSWLEGSVS